MLTKTIDEAGLRKLFQQGFAKGASEQAIIDYWIRDRAQRTDEEHAAASQNILRAQGKAPVKHLDLGEIRDALKAISAQFGLQRGQLEGQRRSVNDSTKRALAELNRGQGRSIESFRSGAAGRGLLRSGLAVKDTGRIASQFAEQRSAAEGTRAEALRGIQGNLATLKAGETAARAAKARELARAQVGTQEAIARALKLV